jgi:hypothetical protein
MASRKTSRGPVGNVCLLFYAEEKISDEIDDCIDADVVIDVAASQPSWQDPLTTRGWFGQQGIQEILTQNGGMPPCAASTRLVRSKHL